MSGDIVMIINIIFHLFNMGLIFIPNQKVVNGSKLCPIYSQSIVI